MTATTRLGDLVSILGGGTPSRDRADYYNGDIPWVTVKDLKDELTLSSSQERITNLGLENSASRLVPAGNVLVATRMAVGKAVRTLADVAINQDLKAVVCGQRIDSRFLLFFLSSKASLLEAKANGSTVKGILIEDLQELELALPPLSEQQRIATQMEQADRLRRTRRYALELTNTVLPAAFLELFGDPVTNERGWPMEILRSVATKITDGEHLNPRFVPNGFPIVMAEQVEDWGVSLDSCKCVSADDFAKFIRKCEPVESDILIVSRGATIGRTCVVDTKNPFCMMGSAILIKPDSNVINPYFLAALLKSASFLRVLRTTSGASAQQAIYIADLKDKVVTVPPLPLQQKFAALVERVERLRAVQREALRQAEHLFASLLNGAFSG